MRIFISGASGFIGSSLVSYLTRCGNEVFAISRGDVKNSALNELVSYFKFPCLNIENLGGLLEKIKPDVLIHCIGSPTVLFAQNNPLQDFDNTVNSTSISLESIRRFSPNTFFVLFSSAAVYGECPDSLTESSHCHPISIYGHNKRLAELLAIEYGEQFDISTLILRPFSVYGESLRKQVIYDLAKKFIDPLVSELVVDGTGSELRDFIHIADVVGATEYLIKNRITGIVNLGSGAQTSLGVLVEKIAKLTNLSKAVKFSGISSPLHPVNLVSDSSYINNLGYRIAVNLDQGLSDVIGSIKDLK